MKKKSIKNQEYKNFIEVLKRISIEKLQRNKEELQDDLKRPDSAYLIGWDDAEYCIYSFIQDTIKRLENGYYDF